MEKTQDTLTGGSGGGVSQDQPMAFQPAIPQDPAAFQSAIPQDPAAYQSAIPQDPAALQPTIPPQWNYGAPAFVAQEAPPMYSQPMYSQPVVYYFAQPGGPVAQIPPTVPSVGSNIINPDDVITDYTVFVIMTTILCAVLAFPSILVGMPAIYLAVQSRQSKSIGSYKRAQQYSVASYYFGLGTVVLGGFLFTLWVCLLLRYKAFPF